MRILQICPDFPPFVRGGGAETFNLLAEGWRRSGHDVTVVTSVPSREYNMLSIDSPSLDVKYFRLIDPPSRFHEMAYFLPLKALESIRLYRFLKQHIAKTDVIMIHGILETISLVSILLLRKQVGKIILTQHGISTAEHTPAFRVISKVLYKTLGKIAISNVNSIVVYCRRTKEEFIAYFGNSRSFSITEIPLGIDIRNFKSKYDSAREKVKDLEKWAIGVGILNNEFLFAIGRNVRTKGFDVLIRSLAVLRSEFPSLKLVIAGDKTEYTPRLQDLADELELKEMIIFAGRLSEEQKIHLMTKCACFVIPSRKEGYGLNAVEAAILNVPCVATDTGAHPEILSRSRVAKIVEPGNSDALALGLSTMLQAKGPGATFDSTTATTFDIESLSKKYTQMLSDRKT